MKAICVYCGSSSGNKPIHQEKARQMGQEIARNGLRVVTGGSRYGLMGQVVEGSLELGGKTIGVLPEALKAKELSHPKLTELFVVKDMHERKAKMAELSDAFIALPGGFGTLEEVMEMITWNQLNFQAKPIGFLNADNFFDSLYKFLEQAAGNGFINPGLIKALIVESEPEKLLERLLKESWPKLNPWPIVS